MDTGIEIFATKGVEYLVVIGYLMLLVVFWQIVRRPTGRARQPASALPVPATPFTPRGDVAYHQGHAWARPRPDGTVRVGMDDFARRLLGAPQAFRLPAVGMRLDQGRPGWDVIVGDTAVPMLAPVDGEVVRVNPDVVADPRLPSSEPYDRGWLLEVRVPAESGSLANLLRRNVARAWLDDTAERVRAMATPELGVLLPDGGVPVDGLARALAPDRWVDVAREFLLTEPPSPASSGDAHHDGPTA